MASHPAGKASGCETPSGPAAGRPRTEGALPAHDVAAAIVELMEPAPSFASHPGFSGFTLFRLFPAVTALHPPAFDSACESGTINTPQAGARPCE